MKTCSTFCLLSTRAGDREIKKMCCDLSLDLPRQDS